MHSVSHPAMAPAPSREALVHMVDNNDKSSISSVSHPPFPLMTTTQCFRASDIVLYTTTMLEGGPRYTARELAQYAKERGMYLAEDMYRRGFPCTNRLERVTAVTHSWVSAARQR